MNHVYRLVFNPCLGQFQAVAESAKARSSRPGSGALSGAAGAVLLLLGGALTAGQALAGPQGAQVVSGSASVVQSGATTTVQQASQNATLNWQSFNVNRGESVNFVQPNAASIAVNRILDVQGSQILGQINANGQIFLINPNGVLFGQGAQVNVGGLVASTLDYVGPNASGGGLFFTGTGSGGAGVSNAGSIMTNSGGYVALLGRQVSNTGQITAPGGSVALVGGSQVTLNMSGTSLIGVQIDQSALETLVANGGLIQADGGRVVLRAGAQESLLPSVVNNTGVIEARTVESRPGNVVLLGGGSAGVVNVGGRIDASAPNGGDGGFVETSAAQVQVASNAVVTTQALPGRGSSGTWLIDPTDFTISSGTAAQSSSGIGASTLQSSLALGNVSIATSTSGSQPGDILVNSAVSWASNNSLTLTASNNINVNAAVTASGTGATLRLVPGGTLNFGPSGSISLPNVTSGTVAVFIGSTGYQVLNSVAGSGGLQSISLSGNYVLGSDLVAGAFTPIGSSATPFTGNLNGFGHAVSGLSLAGSTNVGLISVLGAGGTVSNLGLKGASVVGAAGASGVGALVGENRGSLYNVFVDASSTVAAGTGASNVGGLVGVNQASGSISASYALVPVNAAGASQVGGLVGSNLGTVSLSYAAGAITGDRAVGGLVGLNSGGNGANPASISNSYARGAVTGSGTNRIDIGGLVGRADRGSGSFSNNYAIGGVSGASGVGGLVGSVVNSASCVSCFFDTQATGQSVSATGLGQTTAQMLAASTYASWPAGNWTFYDGRSYPLLTSFLTPLTVTVGSATVQYNGLDQSSSALAGVSYSIYGNSLSSAPANLQGTVGAYANGTAAGSGAVNVVSGGYQNVGGLFSSNQQGYAVTYSISGVPLTITPVTLTVTGQTVTNRPYNGTNSATLANGVLTGLPAADAGKVTLVQQGTFASVNAAATVAVTANDQLTLSGGAVAANYNLVQPTGLSGAITAASLTVTGQTVTAKNYDGTTAATLAGGTLNGVATADAGKVTLVQAGTFNSADAGTAVPVTAKNTLTLTGVSADNYTLVQPTGLVGVIRPLALTVSGASALNKSYDGTTAATLSTGTLVGVVAGQTAPALVATGTFASPNVGTNIAVVANYSLTGTGAGNYTVTQPVGLTASITPASLIITAATASRIYGQANPVLAGTVTGFVGADNLATTTSGALTFSTTATAASNVGTYAVTGGGLTATNGNYLLTQAAGNASALTITPAPLAVAGQTASNKVYDSTTNATLVGGTLLGLVNNDILSLVPSGSFAQSSVGTAIPVVAKNTLTGTAAGNYTLAQPQGLTANITPAPLTVAGQTAADKVFDGRTPTTVTGGSLVGVVASDSANVSLVAPTTGNFVTPYVGQNIAVTPVTPNALTGSAAGNYALVQPALRANISANPAVTAAQQVQSLLGAQVLGGNSLAPAFGSTLGALVTVVALAGPDDAKPLPDPTRALVIQPNNVMQTMILHINIAEDGVKLPENTVKLGEPLPTAN